jgi:spermidine dehydrogenase
MAEHDDAVSGDGVTRRDFVQGTLAGSMALGALPVLQACTGEQPAVTAADYPPLRTGMRGSHPGSFEVAHALRDGEAIGQARAGAPDATYDLIVVGGGISGLSAATFYRDRAPDARVLILENHDDFGGHAKRNEFHVDDRILLLNGGTAGIDSPRPYSSVADGLFKRIGIDVPKLAEAERSAAEGRPQQALQRAVFFDSATFGSDKLVTGVGQREWAEILAESPLSQPARDDVLKVEAGTADPWPTLDGAAKKDRLSRVSYRDYLTGTLGIGAEAMKVYQNRPLGWWGVGADGITALDAWAMGFPGFQALKLPDGAIDRMGYTPRGFAESGGSYSYHFPDGNGTVARLLTNNLIPGVLPTKDAVESVVARADYAALDRADQPVRIRLSSTVVHVANRDAGGVEVIYSRDGKLSKVAARHCVLACWNMMIPYLCPDLPDPQKAALHELVKVPLVYVSVLLDNWRAFDKAKVGGMTLPGAYYHDASLSSGEEGVGLDAKSPDDPAVLHLTRVPCSPGLPERDQCRAGRAELLVTDFATFENNLRDVRDRAMGPSGFDSKRDIKAITVNRWPHGYAPEYNPLWDEVPDGPNAPNVIGRARFGAITIANSDSGRAAYTDSAIDQAHRAVGELFA